MLVKHLDDIQKQKYNWLLGQIRLLDTSKPSGNQNVDEGRRNKFLKVRAQLDELIAPECLLCGSISIDLIDKPFFEEGLESHSWQLE